MQMAILILAQVIITVGLIGGLRIVQKQFPVKWLTGIKGLDFLPALGLIYVILICSVTDKWDLLFDFLLAWAVVILVVIVIRILSAKPLAKGQLRKLAWRISDLLVPVLWLIIIGLAVL